MAALCLVGLLFTPSVSAQMADIETFEDDTAGANPTSPDYTYTESGAHGVTAAEGFPPSAQSFFADVEDNQWAAFEYGSQDICAANTAFHFNFKVTSFGAESVSQTLLGFAQAGAANGAAGWQVGVAEPYIRIEKRANIGTDANTLQIIMKGGTGASEVGTPGPVIDLNVWHNAYFTTDCTAKTASLNVLPDGGTGYTITSGAVPTGSMLTAPLNTVTTGNAGYGGAGAGPEWRLDNFCFGACGDAPEAPAGLSALVTDAKTTEDLADEAMVDLRWPVSPGDPDQEQGAYRYDIYVNGFSIGADATTAADGEGVRYNQVNFVGGIILSDTVFTIRAVNLTTGLQSAQSCAVVVDPSVFGDFGSCGGAFPGGGIGAGGALDFTTPTDTAAGLQGFCSDLMGDSEGSLFMCGLILIVIVFLGIGAAFATLAGAPGLPAVVAGSVGAFGMVIFNVLAGIWALIWAIVLIILVAAITTITARNVFMGRGGSGG